MRLGLTGADPGGHGESESDRSGGGDRRVRILVVDDHPVVRFGLCALLRSQPDFEVVGEAASCAEACEALAKAAPDVVILDLELGDANGAEALSRVRAVSPRVPVIVFTAHDNDWRVVEAVRVGLQGYLVKGTRAETLCEAVRVVDRGGYYLDPAVTSLVMGQVGRNDERRRPQARYLTEREKAVLRLLAEGRRNKEIARVLQISERTVKYHIAALLSKLGATNRTEVVRTAVNEGIISL
jgi:DNA-binding NarL/FixJ family response regulator